MGAYELAARVGVDFILVGAPEREAHPGVEDRYASIGERLVEVFRNPAMTIYAVQRPGGHTRLH